MSETITENVFLDPNLICEECLIKKCTHVTLNFEKKICEDCSHELGIETISVNILNNVKTIEQLESYKNQVSLYDVLSDLLDNKLSQYDVALDVLDTLYEERCGWIEEYYQENMELLNISQNEFSRDRDELLNSLKNQLTEDKIEPKSLEMIAYNNSQKILGAAVISSVHGEHNEAVNYVSSTMRIEWSSPYELFSPHKIQYISAKTREMINIDVLSGYCDKITVKKLNLGKGASWCKLATDTIFYCGGVGSWMHNPPSYLLFHHPDDIFLDQQPDMMLNKRINHSVVAFNSDLYAIGGYTNNSKFKAIEKFNLESQKWEQVSTIIEEELGSSSTCKIDDGILIAGENAHCIFLFDPEKKEITGIPFACGKKILLKSNDAVYCLVGRSLYTLYKDHLKKINFRLVKDGLNCKGNWWMPSQEVIVGTKIFFISQDEGAAELWDLDVSSSDYILTKYDIKL